MFLKKSRAAAFALGLSAASALADEVTPDWSGPYIGGHAGYTQNYSPRKSLEVSGAVAGFHGGYNAQFGQLVLGVEGDYTFADANGSRIVPLGGGNGDLSVNANIDYLASVRGRVGIANSSGLMFFGTAGFGWSHFSTSASAPAVNFKFHREASYDGVVAGGGVEYQFTPMIVGRVEGLRYFLDQQNGSGELNQWTARAGVSIRFPTGSTGMSAN